MRRPLSKVAYEAFLAIPFGAQLQNLLFPHEVEGQCTCDDEGQVFHRFAVEISGIVLKDTRVGNLVEAQELIFHAGVAAMLAIVQEVDVTFQELVVCVSVRVHEVGDAKGRTTDGDDVHPAVIVALHDLDDFRCAAYADDSSGQGKQHTELAFVVAAAAHHLAIARLENVQRESCAGKKNDVQRKKGNAVRANESHS